MTKKSQECHLPSVKTHTLTYYDMDQLSDVIKGASFEIEQLENGNFHADLFSASVENGILDIVI